MRSFAFERWDDGRLTVNRDFAPLFRAHGLTTFHALMHELGGEVAKNLLRERTTSRFILDDEHGSQRGFYVKRHRPPPVKEYVKPLLRLTWPVLGARNEWNALLDFHAAGISTMTPVSLGEAGGESFLVTESLDGCAKLSHLLEDGNGGLPEPAKRRLVAAVAELARRMHGAGLHHQDFYLTHLLLPSDLREPAVHVIDLGRAHRRRRLSRRWIVKDLAQLNYSAGSVTRADRMRFVRAYLGRRVRDEDRRLLERIERKTRAIARHSRKNRL